MTAEVSGLVDAELGMISHRIFIEPKINGTELQRTFARIVLARGITGYAALGMMV
jgi:hypothetical protein